MNKTVIREIGQRVREARLSAGLTQADLARGCSVTRQAVSAWERGASVPNLVDLRELGPLLGVSLDFLVYGIKTIPVSQYPMVSEVFRVREYSPA